MLELGEVAGHRAAMEVVRRRRPGLGEHCLCAAPSECAHPEGDPVLGNALAVPVFERVFGFDEEAAERAGQAHIEAGEGVPERGDHVAGEGFARGRRAFGKDEQLCAVVGGAFAVEDSGVRPPVDRLSINDGELANLEGFGQNGPSFAARNGHGKAEGNAPLPESFDPGKAPACTETTAYHRVFAVNQPSARPSVRVSPGFQPACSPMSPRYTRTPFGDAGRAHEPWTAEIAAC